MPRFFTDTFVRQISVASLSRLIYMLRKQTSRHGRTIPSSIWSEINFTIKKIKKIRDRKVKRNVYQCVAQSAVCPSAHNSQYPNFKRLKDIYFTTIRDRRLSYCDDHCALVLVLQIFRTRAEIRSIIKNKKSKKYFNKKKKTVLEIK